VELDINQALSERFQVRLDVMGQLAGVARRDAVEQNRLGVAPSARLTLGENTSLEFDYLYQREDSVPDYGQPYFNGSPVSETLGVPREAFYGVVGSDTEEVGAHVATARLQHRFGEGVQLTNTLRYGRVDRFSRPTSPRGLTPAAAPTVIGRQRYETETDNTNLINQTDLRGELKTGPLAHTLNVGVELSRETRDQERHNLNAVGLPTGTNLPADLFSPEPEPDLSAVNRVFSNANDTRQTTLAFYAADQVAVTKYLEVLGSLRLDRFSTDYALTSADGTRTPLENSDTLFNWRTGLVVHPVEQTSLYAMYGTSANPSAEAGALTADTVSLDPERNAITELGAKADLLEERLGLSGAVFQVRKLNARVPNTDPEGPPQILAGEQRVRGFNVGVAGAPRAGWRVLANYTYMDSEIREHTNAYLVGQRLPNTPEHSVSLWTTLEVMEGLTLGGGAIYQSVTAVNNPTSEAQVLNKVPNYWRFDAYASYAFKRVELQLNLNNLSDAFYYEQYYSGHAVPAAGRSATLTGSFRF
jgi:catecholate siderophore receptor